MKVLAIFTESAVPKTGLTPLIKIYRLDTNELVIDDEEMLEVGNGQYSYNFIDWDYNLDYSVVCDSVTLTGSERYSYTTISDQIDVKFIKNVEGGRWHLINNQMVFYEEDNVTEIMRFNLFNKQGQPTTTDVYNRNRI